MFILTIMTNRGPTYSKKLLQSVGIVKYDPLLHGQFSSRYSQRHHIACSQGWDIWCLLWVQSIFHTSTKPLPGPVFEELKIRPLIKGVLSLWHKEAQWWHRYGSTLAQVMSWCLMAPSHYLNQFWLLISEVKWQSPQGKQPQPSVNKISSKTTVPT